jgi:hypothetical protein
MSLTSRAAFLIACAAAPLAAAQPAWSQTAIERAIEAARSATGGAGQPRPQPQQNDPLQQAIAKSNAYIGLMNRTLRAVEAWDRYRSWVNLKTGPTGRERYITYGIYSLYDVRREIEAAEAAVAQPPAAPELDATIKRYIAAYQAFAPAVTQASGYYERQDYRSDGMAEGKALHARMAPAAEVFLRERALLDAQMRTFKSDVDQRELAAIEAREGKSRHWHVRNVMIEGRRILDLMPSNASPVVNMAEFDRTLAVYAAAVRQLDEFAQANPNALSSFQNQPRSMLGKLREYREALNRAKGDGRRARADTTWIVNDYNMMVSMSQMAIRMP